MKNILTRDKLIRNINEAYRYRGDWKQMMKDLAFERWVKGNEDVKVGEAGKLLKKGTYVVKGGNNSNDEELADYLAAGDGDEIQAWCHNVDKNIWSYCSFDAEGFGAAEINDEYWRLIGDEDEDADGNEA